MQTNTNKQYEDLYKVATEFFPDSKYEKLKKDTIHPFFNNFEKQSLERSRNYSIFDGNYLDVALIYRCISDKIVNYIRSKYNLDYRKFNKTLALSYKDEILENNYFFLLPTELYCNVFKNLQNNIKNNKSNNSLVNNFQKIISKLSEQIVIDNEAKNIKNGYISAKCFLKLRLQKFANLNYLHIEIDSNINDEFNFKICDLLNIVNYQNFADIDQIKDFTKYTICNESCTDNIIKIEEAFESHLLLNNILKENAQQQFNSMYIHSNTKFPIENSAICELLNTFRIKNVPLPKHIYIYYHSGRDLSYFMFFGFLLSFVVENYPLENFYFIMNSRDFEYQLKFDLIISFNKVSTRNTLFNKDSNLEDINYIYQHLSDNGKAICNFKTHEYDRHQPRNKIKYKFPNYILEKNHIECIVENINYDFYDTSRYDFKKFYTILIDKSRTQNANDNDKIVMIRRPFANTNSKEKNSDLFVKNAQQLCSIFNYYYDDSVFRKKNEFFFLNKIFFRQVKDKNFVYYFDSYRDIHNDNYESEKLKFVSQVETDIFSNSCDYYYDD